jgi:hypothetical protein
LQLSHLQQQICSIVVVFVVHNIRRGVVFAIKYLSWSELYSKNRFALTAAPGLLKGTQVAATLAYACLELRVPGVSLQLCPNSIYTSPEIPGKMAMTAR